MKTIVLLVAVAAVAGCTRVESVRLQDETVEVGPGLRPVAAIQASAISAYILFIPIPGGVTLDKVINQMLIVQAKLMGADKVTNLQFDIDPAGGIWALWGILGYRSAHARGIAVQVISPKPLPDPAADKGPEGPPR
jgi:hypothetical protein